MFSMKRYFGGYCLGSAAGVCGIVCLLPLINFLLNGGTIAVTPRNIALRSPNFFNALVACIASTVPISLDYFLSLLYSSNVKAVTRGWITRAVLLSAVVIPNILVLTVAIPLRNDVIMICLYRLRNVLIVASMLGHLQEFGAPIFRCNLLLLSAVMLMIVPTSLAFFETSISFSFQGLVASTIALTVTGLVILCYLGYRWIKMLIFKKFRDITLSEHSCNCFFICIVILSASYMSLIASYEDSYPRNMTETELVQTTYWVTAFTLFVFIIQNRIINAEVTAHQQTLDMKRMFVRYVSHEIRTPLNTVFVGLDVLKTELRKNGADKETIGIINELHISCDNALVILNDLLNYEKLDAGLMVLEKSVVKAASFLRDAITPFNIQARRVKITLESTNFESDLSDLYLNIDESKISQVVRNFLSNALKFTPKGSTVYISAKVDEFTSEITDMPMLRFEVRDTGTGISKENISKVFKEIIQFSPGKLQNGGGSGLGLWISKNIIDLHGGQVFVSSEGEGLGSTFSFIIPFCSAPSSSDNAADNSERDGSEDEKERDWIDSVRQESMSRDAGYSNYVVPVDESVLTIRSNRADARVDEVISAPSSGRVDSTHLSLHILVVDDSPSTRKMMCRGLKSRGYVNIEEAEHGAEAVKKVESAMTRGNTFDVILIDYQMPVVDGPTAAQHMRSIRFIGYIVGITGNALPSDTDFFMSQGADIVLTKPVVMDSLQVILQERFKFSLISECNNTFTV